MLGFLGKISEEKLYVYIIFTLSLFIPGVGLLYYSDPEIFLSLGTTQIIVLSIFYSLPLLIISESLIIPLLKKTREEKGLVTNDDYEHRLIMSILGSLNILLFYWALGLVVNYPVIDLDIGGSFKSEVYIVFTLQNLLSLFGIWIYFKWKK